MKHLSVFLAACALASAPAAQNPTFHTDVRLVRLQVTVKNAEGGIVAGLDKGDFAVAESGVPQEVAVFERHTELPLSVEVLVDTSGSTQIDLDYEIASVSRFFRAVLRGGNPEDAAALYSFDWQVTLRAEFTRRMDRLNQALKTLRGEGGTSLYDAICLASRDLGRREGRHAMIVVTDGGDTTSVRDFDSALEAAQRTDSSLYAVVVVPIPNDAGRNTGGEHALATMAARTGGRVFLPAPGAELDRAFDDILRELRTQYLLAYYPRKVPPSKDRFHTVAVTLRRPYLRAITRSGYYEDSDP